jgi:hypothetical protein
LAERIEQRHQKPRAGIGEQLIDAYEPGEGLQVFRVESAAVFEGEAIASLGGAFGDAGQAVQVTVDGALVYFELVRQLLRAERHVLVEFQKDGRQPEGQRVVFGLLHLRAPVFDGVECDVAP